MLEETILSGLLHNEDYMRRVIPFLSEERVKSTGLIKPLFVALSRSSNRMFITYSPKRTAFLSQANQDILKEYVD